MAPSSTPSTRTTAEDAIDIAHAALTRRVLSRMPGLLDEEEVRQDLALYVLERLTRWDPSRGALSTFVHVQFDQWWKNNIVARRKRSEMEATYDPITTRDDDGGIKVPGLLVSESASSVERHEQSELAEVLLSLLPDNCREIAELHYAYGVSRSAVAEITGLPEPTVNYRARKARAIWRDSYEIAA